MVALPDVDGDGIGDLAFLELNDTSGPCGQLRLALMEREGLIRKSTVLWRAEQPSRQVVSGPCTYGMALDWLPTRDDAIVRIVVGCPQWLPSQAKGLVSNLVVVEVGADLQASSVAEISVPNEMIRAGASRSLGWGVCALSEWDGGGGWTLAAGDPWAGGDMTEEVGRNGIVPVPGSGGCVWIIEVDRSYSILRWHPIWSVDVGAGQGDGRLGSSLCTLGSPAVGTWRIAVGSDAEERNTGGMGSVRIIDYRRDTGATLVAVLSADDVDSGIADRALRFGGSVCAVGDLDANGFPDVGVGVPAYDSRYLDENYARRGAVWIGLLDGTCQLIGAELVLGPRSDDRGGFGDGLAMWPAVRSGKSAELLLVRNGGWREGGQVAGYRIAARVH